MKVFNLSLCVCIGFLLSCKKDLNLNAPYKEIPSIFAVMNPQEKIQMIRINKVFLGEGDANQAAQVADSVNYPEGDLEVMLERFDANGNKLPASPTGNKTSILFHDSVVQTVAGPFATKQRIYVTGDRLFTSGIYRLRVTNKRSGNVFTSSSPALDSVELSGYIPLRVPVYDSVKANPSKYIGNEAVAYLDYSDPAQAYTIRFRPTPAAIYQVTMRVYYRDSTATGIFPEYADYVFARQTNKDVTIFSQQQWIVNTFKGDDLYYGIALAVSKSSRPLSVILGRKVYKMGFMVMAATQDYYDYLQFSAPSLSIAQEKPLYSNFDNRAALGLFTFRSRLSIDKAVDNNFVSRFALHPATCPLKFVTSSDAKGPCQ